MAANGNEAVSLSQLKALSDSIGAEVDGKVASPASAGTAGQVLSTNGTATEWIDLPEGTVYTGTAPITVSGSAIGITAASTGAAGSMSAADKAKLDGIDANANNYVLPAATASTIGGVKPGTGCEVTGDGTLNVTVTGGGDYELPIASYTALGGVLAFPEDTVSGALVRIMNGLDTRGVPEPGYPNGTIFVKSATISEDGAMSYSDKAKLDGIAANANNYVLPSASSTVLGGVKFATDTDFNAYMGIS